jgi:hydrogenase maturation protease
MKTLVLGLGNPLLRDDAVGLHVARRLQSLLGGRPDVEVDEDYRGGLRLMERLIGFDRAIIVDAMCSGANPGTVHRLTPDGVPTQHSASAHDANLRTALDLGRRAGAKLPADDGIMLIGIEASDVLSFDESLTPEVEAAIPGAVHLVLDELQEERGEP